MTMKTCSIETCDRPVACRGLCGGHYQKWRSATLGPCSVDGCETPIYNKTAGLCPAHYQQARKSKITDECRVEACGNRVEYLDDQLCQKHYVRLRQRGSTDDPEQHGNHRGRSIGYTGAHERVRRRHGAASQYRCSCGAQAAEWAYDKTDPDELTEIVNNIVVPYSPDTFRYKPMCRSCHRTFDAPIKRAVEPA